MPHTLAALASGTLSEWRATVLARESACLSRADRILFDKEIAGDPAALTGLGTKALTARAKFIALRLDTASVVARARRAESERCVTIRPAPDTMTYLTALLPVAQGVAAYAALTRAADSARATGDPRTRGQVMADELIARIVAGAAGTPPSATLAAASARTSGGAPGNSSAITPDNSLAVVPESRPTARLEVQLVMTDRTLLAGDDEPAHVPGYGAVPGAWARDLVLDALDSGKCDVAEPDRAGRDPAATGRGPLACAQVWVRRLFTAPTTGQLVAMDSRARLAPRGLADLIRARDAGACRTPYCDAPIRHIDHVVPNTDGGPTSADNLQGLCEGCNYAKQAPGWHEVPRPVPRPPGGGEPGAAVPDVSITTPTGHRYLSRPPALPGAFADRRRQPDNPSRAPVSLGGGGRSAEGRSAETVVSPLVGSTRSRARPLRPHSPARRRLPAHRRRAARPRRVWSSAGLRISRRSPGRR
jgi:hypothetical protein